MNFREHITQPAPSGDVRQFSLPLGGWIPGLEVDEVDMIGHAGFQRSWDTANASASDTHTLAYQPKNKIVPF